MENGQVCPVCGTTIEDFRRSGLLGCANCYTVFREEIGGMVRRTQKSDLHVGKFPSVKEEKYSFILEQQLLKESLERALREKRYADAEQFKERLRESNRILREEERK